MHSSIANKNYALGMVVITKVDVISLRIPMKVPVKIANGPARNFMDTILVRIHTNKDIEGIGETQAWRRQGSGEVPAGILSVIRDLFTPLLVGRSPFDIASIMQSLEQASWHSLYAQAAISDALFDLQGKLLGLPVYELLGGKCRNGLQACAVLFIKPTIEQTIDGAVEFYERGFRSFTIKVGINLDIDIKTISALRERLGSEVIIRVDANAGMDIDSAKSMLQKLSPYDLDAAEQLLPIWDINGMSTLARQVTTPMMADESLATEHDLIALILQNACSVIHTKIGKNGGIWGLRKLWTIAAAAGMRIYPGNHPSTSIATLAVMHLGVSWPTPLLDGAFAVGSETLEGDVIRDPIQMQGSTLIIPEAPGLGFELNEDSLREFHHPLQV